MRITRVLGQIALVAGLMLAPACTTDDDDQQEDQEEVAEDQQEDDDGEIVAEAATVEEDMLVAHPVEGDGEIIADTTADGLAEVVAEGIDEAPPAEGAAVGMDEMMGADMPLAAADPVAAAPAATTPAKGMTAPIGMGDSFDYVIVKGDFLSKIALRVYGDPGRWRDLVSANPQIKNPHLVYPGDVVRVTVDSEAAIQFARRYVPLAGTGQVVHTRSVVRGDSLSEIAKDVLGQALLWRAIYEQNRDIVAEPNLIEVGQTLVFTAPEGGSPGQESGKTKSMF